MSKAKARTAKTAPRKRAAASRKSPMTDEMRAFVGSVRTFMRHMANSVPLDGAAEHARLGVLTAAGELLGEKDVA